MIIVTVDRVIVLQNYEASNETFRLEISAARPLRRQQGREHLLRKLHLEGNNVQQSGILVDTQITNAHFTNIMNE